MAKFVVTNQNDSGAGSLRQAIADANASAGLDTITFSVSGTITLTSGQLVISDDVIIDGDATNDGIGDIIINGNASDRVVQVTSGTSVTLTNLTLTNGTSAAQGGAIFECRQSDTRECRGHVEHCH